MKPSAFPFLLLFLAGNAFAQQSWPLDALENPRALIAGQATLVPGVKGQAFSLDGRSLLELRNTATLDPAPEFTFLVWCNPYLVEGEQRMVAAKNRYSTNERQWGVMIDRDGKVRLYVWQDGWTTAAATTAPQPGHWHRLGVVLREDSAGLWVNGSLEGRAALSRPIPATAAPSPSAACSTVHRASPSSVPSTWPRPSPAPSRRKR